MIAYIVFSSTFAPPGTLVVRAGSDGSPLSVTFSLQGVQGSTPMNFSLSGGSYTVDFSNLTWYSSPSPVTIVVLSGQTAYAYGAYTPIPKAISIANDAFNESRVAVLHGVTPVTWVNRGENAVALVGVGFPSVTIPPGGSRTYVFPSAGTYTIEIQGTSSYDTITAQ